MIHRHSIIVVSELYSRVCCLCSLQGWWECSDVIGPTTMICLRLSLFKGVPSFIRQSFNQGLVRLVIGQPLAAELRLIFDSLRSSFHSLCSLCRLGLSHLATINKNQQPETYECTQCMILMNCVTFFDLVPACRFLLPT